MKKNKLKIIIIFSITALLVLFLLVINSTGDADKFSFIKSKVPDNFKIYLKENISYFKAKELEKQFKKLKNENIKINKKRVSNWRNLSENHMRYMDLYLKVIDQKNITSTDNKKYSLKKFKIPFFDLDYYEWEQKPIGYLEQTNEKVFFVTGNGVFMSYDKKK